VGAPLADAREDLGELGGRDAAVAVDVVDVEGGAQLGLELAIVAAAAAVEGRELAEVDVAVAVSVEHVHHGGHLAGAVGGARRRGDGARDRRQLRGRDPAVAVRVEAGEDLLDLSVCRGDRRRGLLLRLLLLGGVARHGARGTKAKLAQVEVDGKRLVGRVLLLFRDELRRRGSPEEVDGIPKILIGRGAVAETSERSRADTQRTDHSFFPDKENAPARVVQ
jgi:hypothetical protein